MYKKILIYLVFAIILIGAVILSTLVIIPPYERVYRAYLNLMDSFQSTEGNFLFEESFANAHVRVDHLLIQVNLLEYIDGLTEKYLSRIGREVPIYFEYGFYSILDLRRMGEHIERKLGLTIISSGVTLRTNSYFIVLHESDEDSFMSLLEYRDLYLSQKPIEIIFYRPLDIDDDLVIMNLQNPRYISTIFFVDR